MLLRARFGGPFALRGQDVRALHAENAAGLLFNRGT
jgi:hypothetical protein